MVHKQNRAKCNNCGVWFEIFPSKEEKMECPECRETDYTILGVVAEFRGKLLYSKAESVEDYIEITEEQLRELKKLKNEGFECDELNSPVQDYHRLYREYDRSSENREGF